MCINHTKQCHKLGRTLLLPDNAPNNHKCHFGGQIRWGGLDRKIHMWEALYNNWCQWYNQKWWRMCSSTVHLLPVHFDFKQGQIAKSFGMNFGGSHQPRYNRLCIKFWPGCRWDWGSWRTQNEWFQLLSLFRRCPRTPLSQKLIIELIGWSWEYLHQWDLVS